MESSPGNVLARTLARNASLPDIGLCLGHIDYSRQFAMITQGTHVFNLSLYKALRYDPQSIVPITLIAAVSSVMTVHPSNPANTPLQVAAAAKAAPG
jgi:hypothetical protein